jgi:hypothetical protein
VDNGHDQADNEIQHTYPPGIGIRYAHDPMLNLVTIQVTHEEVARTQEVADAVSTLLSYAARNHPNLPRQSITSYPEELSPVVDNPVNTEE